MSWRYTREGEEREGEREGGREGGRVGEEGEKGQLCVM